MFCTSSVKVLQSLQNIQSFNVLEETGLFYLKDALISCISLRISQSQFTFFLKITQGRFLLKSDLFHLPSDVIHYPFLWTFPVRKVALVRVKI